MGESSEGKKVPRISERSYGKALRERQEQELRSFEETAEDIIKQHSGSLTSEQFDYKVLIRDRMLGRRMRIGEMVERLDAMKRIPPEATAPMELPLRVATAEAYLVKRRGTILVEIKPSATRIRNRKRFIAREMPTETRIFDVQFEKMNRWLAGYIAKSPPIPEDHIQLQTTVIREMLSRNPKLSLHQMILENNARDWSANPTYFEALRRMWNQKQGSRGE